MTGLHSMSLGLLGAAEARPRQTREKTANMLETMLSLLLATDLISFYSESCQLSSARDCWLKQQLVGGRDCDQNNR